MSGEDESRRVVQRFDEYEIKDVVDVFTVIQKKAEFSVLSQNKGDVGFNARRIWPNLFAAHDIVGIPGTPPIGRLESTGRLIRRPSVGGITRYLSRGNIESPLTEERSVHALSFLQRKSFSLVTFKGKINALSLRTGL